MKNLAHTACCAFKSQVKFRSCNRSVLFRIFDDPEQYRQEALLSRERDRFRESISSGRTNWFGRSDLNSWEDAVALSTQPWQAGIDRVHRFVQQLEVQLPEPMDRRRRRRWDERDGDDIDYDRLRSAQPYWRSTRRAWSSAPQHVAIFVDVGTTMSYTAEQMVWRGVTAMAVSHLLEREGYSAEIWSVNYSQMGIGHLFQAIPLKRAGESLDESLVANYLSPWWYRSLTFQTRYSTRWPAGNNEPGSSSPPTASMLDFVRPTSADTARLYLADLWSEKEAVETANEFLGAFGDELAACYEEAE